MWHTSDGDRVLEGAEARLFRSGVAALVEQVTQFEGWACGITLFDELTQSQQLAVLESVATPLLTADRPSPELTAVNEAAIGAVFEQIRLEVEMEIDDLRPSTEWRQRILDACREKVVDSANEFVLSPEDDFDEGATPWIPEFANSSDGELWHSAIEHLTDRILWDRDYEMMGEFLDEPPEKAALLRQILGIDDTYFAVAAADLNSSEQTDRTLRQLTRILQQED